MNLQDSFIANLKYYRKLKSLTQKDLSIALDKSFNYVNGIEGKVSFPPPGTIDQIAFILGISPQQLFDEQGCPENVVKFDKTEFTNSIADRVYRTGIERNI